MRVTLYGLDWTHLDCWSLDLDTEHKIHVVPIFTETKTTPRLAMMAHICRVGLAMMAQSVIGQLAAAWPISIENSEFLRTKTEKIDLDFLQLKVRRWWSHKIRHRQAHRGSPKSCHTLPYLTRYRRNDHSWRQSIIHHKLNARTRSWASSMRILGPVRGESSLTDF